MFRSEMGSGSKAHKKHHFLESGQNIITIFIRAHIILVDLSKIMTYKNVM